MPLEIGLPMGLSLRERARRNKPCRIFTKPALRVRGYFRRNSEFIGVCPVPGGSAGNWSIMAPARDGASDLRLADRKALRRVPRAGTIQGSECPQAPITPDNR